MVLKQTSLILLKMIFIAIILLQHHLCLSNESKYKYKYEYNDNMERINETKNESEIDWITYRHNGYSMGFKSESLEYECPSILCDKENIDINM